MIVAAIRCWIVLILACSATAEEVNPVRPAAARLLANRAACIRFATEVGEKIGAVKTGTADVYSGDAGVAILFLGLHRATDIISGAAGVGMFLINLNAATKSHAADIDAAAAYLAKLADRKDGKARWRGSPGSHSYVGFSHGAAGIGYFLLHAARVTGKKEYRVLAEEAACYVVSMAKKEGSDGWHWWRTDPPQESEMVRIQWCHGAPGIGLFFADFVLHTRTHKTALARCLATTRRHGRTVRRSGCQCHGVAGNAELLLYAYPVLKDRALLEDARRFGSALLEPHGDGFRVSGEYSASYMTGWAGIGHYFLRLADPAEFALPLMVAREHVARRIDR